MPVEHMPKRSSEEIKEEIDALPTAEELNVDPEQLRKVLRDLDMLAELVRGDLPPPSAAEQAERRKQEILEAAELLRGGAMIDENGDVRLSDEQIRNAVRNGQHEIEQRRRQLERALNVAQQAEYATSPEARERREALTRDAEVVREHFREQIRNDIRAAIEMPTGEFQEVQAILRDEVTAAQLLEDPAKWEGAIHRLQQFMGEKSSPYRKGQLAMLYDDKMKLPTRAEDIDAFIDANFPASIVRVAPGEYRASDWMTEAKKMFAKRSGNTEGAAMSTDASALFREVVRAYVERAKPIEPFIRSYGKYEDRRTPDASLFGNPATDYLILGVLDEERGDAYIHDSCPDHRVCEELIGRFFGWGEAELWGWAGTRDRLPAMAENNFDNDDAAMRKIREHIYKTDEPRWRADIHLELLKTTIRRELGNGTTKQDNEDVYTELADAAGVRDS